MDSYQNEIQALCSRLKLGCAIPSMLPELSTSEHQIIHKVLVATDEQRNLVALSRRLKRAKLNTSKSLAVYEFGNFEQPVRLSREEMIGCEFVRNAENLIFFGSPGTGKTHLANALGIEACKLKFNVCFYSTSEFVSVLTETFKAGDLPAFLRNLSRLDLLILDEWGYLPLEPVGAQLLFRVISEFYENKSIILTTNLAFSEWDKIFNDKKLTGAILDRMIHHSHFIQFSGESYRIAHSLMG